MSGIKDTGVDHNFVGDLTIHFSQDGLLRALNPIEVSILFEVDSTSGAPDTAIPIKACGAYDKDSALLGQLNDLRTEFEKFKKSALTCTPTLAQAMTTAGVTDLGSCPSGQTCQNQSVDYKVASSDTCTPASKSVCASCVTQQQNPNLVPRPVNFFTYGAGFFDEIQCMTTQD